LLTKPIPDGFNRWVDERSRPLHLYALEPLGLGDTQDTHVSVEEIDAYNVKET
jgi:hypothetical protein